MIAFDPNSSAASDSGIFGLPGDEEQAKLVYLPVPWEVTTSYGGGTSSGPAAILEASKQVDLFDVDVLKPYEAGLFMLPLDEQIVAWNEEGKGLAQQFHESEDADALKRINALGNLLNEKVYSETRRLLKAGKHVGIVGGDHSVPFGALKAMGEKHPSYGILHFDAHSDTRNAYEGFKWSHASIMHNVLEQIPQVKTLVQVGIRDFCEQEFDYTQHQGARVATFFDRDLVARKYAGKSWADTSAEIISHLPSEVWISFDIDGLDPRFCPNTGTPVPGGLDFQEANFLIGAVVKSGRKIIGFDLNEVAPDLNNLDNEWDANVGARMLYKLTGWTLASQGLTKVR